MAQAKDVPDLDLKEPLLELFRRAATDLPRDVEEILAAARDKEEEGSAARNALSVILENVRLAREKSTPICQDTGTPVLYVSHPLGWSTARMEEAIRWAAAEATKKSYLRPNAVHPITGKNSGDNTGIGYPYVHFHEWDKNEVVFRMLLKGGGSENCGIQYSLPDSKLGAGRDLKGIKKCVLDAVFRAQGYGCAPGIIGVGVGGDRVSSFEESKIQLFRAPGDKNPDPVLAEMEEELFEKTNRLGIGPMGFGGKTTTLGVKIGVRHRLPACFFVSISYFCWAARRKTMTVKNGEVSYD